MYGFVLLAVEESDIIDLEKRYWLLKAQSRTGRFDLETFVPLVSPPIHASLSEGNQIFMTRLLFNVALCSACRRISTATESIRKYTR